YHVDVAPGESINITERTFEWDGNTNDSLPIVHGTRSASGTSTDGVTDLRVEGAHTITYSISDVTQDVPSGYFLFIGPPQSEHVPETGGRVRVSGNTPIMLDGPQPAYALEYKIWKDGDPEPA